MLDTFSTPLSTLVVMQKFPSRPLVAPCTNVESGSDIKTTLAQSKGLPLASTIVPLTSGCLAPIAAAFISAAAQIIIVVFISFEFIIIF